MGTRLPASPAPDLLEAAHSQKLVAILVLIGGFVWRANVPWLLNGAGA